VLLAGSSRQDADYLQFVLSKARSTLTTNSPPKSWDRFSKMIIFVFGNSSLPESGIDPPHQMIFRDRVAKMKLVEQLTLVTLQTAHHRSTSPRFASAERNHGSPPISTDFRNKIGT
jgi:hypothetical protein